MECLTVHPNGRVLATTATGTKKWCAICDVATGSVGRSFAEPAGTISTAAISPDGRFLATAGEHIIRLRCLT